MILNKRDEYYMKRRKLGISLQAIAKVLGVHKSSVSRYERGEINLRSDKEYMKYIDYHWNKK